MATQFANGKIVTDGLVLCLDAADQTSYPTTGTTWNDLVGSNNGTLTNGPTFNSTNGGSIVFDGVDDYVNIGNIGNYSTISYTLESFIYPEFDSATFGRPFFTKGLNCSQGEFQVEYGRTANKFSFLSSFGQIALTSNLTYPKNNWYHVVITRTNNGNSTYTNRLYVNGILDNTTTVSYPTETTNGDLSIGGKNICSNVSDFLGKITISRIYNKTLSAQEVLQNYNAQKARFGIY
jgi:hypothetical protein